MPRICYMLDDDAHRAFKLACIKTGETMIAANRKMALLYASGLLCKLTDPGNSREDFNVAAQALFDWLKRWEPRA